MGFVGQGCGMREGSGGRINLLELVHGNKVEEIGRIVARAHHEDGKRPEHWLENVRRII